ncbi:MAG: YggS family pyridoxal phosphate-dependent enzyme [Clostridia bacterium]|nr:YggS family pyridoxal phosphate-dependent enzyme [Clostridia bacterium]
MTEREIEILENFKAVRENIDRAAENRKENFSDGLGVSLLAATKTVPAEDVVFAAEHCGLTLAGENRVQEFTAKYDTVKPHLDGYHFIGHLQTNKVKSIVGKTELIHSVGSLHLAEALDRAAAAQGIVQPVLAEINIAAEESKSGFLPDDALHVLDEFDAFSSLKLCGIMTMGPADAEKSALRKYFRETYQIFIDFFAKKRHNIIEAVLSMGMSDSYVDAIEEGATVVRVGSALFGKRNYL